MATVQQYTNRLIEWFTEPQDLISATYVFLELVEGGYSLDEAFKLAIRLCQP